MSDINETLQLNSLIREAFDRLTNHGVSEIYPAAIADDILNALDPDHTTQVMLRHAAMLEFRQLARAVCRQHVEGPTSDDLTGQQELFEGLQPYYPTRRRNDIAWVKREQLTLEERYANIRALRSEGIAKLKHADALEAETEKLRNGGYFEKAG